MRLEQYMRRVCSVLEMKSLFVFVVPISMFYSCAAVLGIMQPSHSHDRVNKGFDVDIVFKKCEDVDGGLLIGSFLDQDFLLCFGVKVFTRQFRAESELRSFFSSVENKPDKEFCKYFQEMILDLPNNYSAGLYNMQFRSKSTCERACLDVVDNVNPLCSFILLSSRHFKGNSSVNGTKALPTALHLGKAQNVGNDVANVKVDPEQSTKNTEEVSNIIPTDHKPKSNDEAKVTTEQKSDINVQKLTPDGPKLSLKSGEDKSNVSDTKIVPPEQPSPGLKSPSQDEDDKLHKQKEQTGGTGIGSDKGKQKATGKGETQDAESGKATNLEEATSIQGKKNGLPLDTNTVNNTLKNTADSKKEPARNTAVDTNSAIKNGNQKKLDSSTGENTPVEMSKSSESNKNDTTVVTRHKSQETTSADEDNVTSKKVVADTDAQKDKSISQMTNTEEGKEIINEPKSQAENPPLNEAELKVSDKTITGDIPKNNIEEQKTSQNNAKAYTNEKPETGPQSGRDDTQKPVSEEMQFTDDAGDGEAELDTHFSVEAGESIDNTEFSSGGGTGIDYARHGSDIIETDKNEISDAGKIMIHETYEDDDSHFFAYFMTTMVFCIVGYLVFHNKQKILALALEGRARRSRRRPNTSGYRKLDSNLEEAISSSKSASVTQVIY